MNFCAEQFKWVYLNEILITYNCEEYPSGIGRKYHLIAQAIVENRQS